MKVESTKISGLLSKLDPENSRPNVVLHNTYVARSYWRSLTYADRISRSSIEEGRLKTVPRLESL